MHDCGCGCGQTCDCDGNDHMMFTPPDCETVGCAYCGADCGECLCAMGLTESERNPSAADGAWPFGP